MRLRSQGASPATTPQPVVATATTTMPRRAIVLCLAPIALLGVVSAFSATNRTMAHAQLSPPAMSAQVSALTAGPSGLRAQQTACSFLTRVLGTQTAIEGSSLISDSSLRYRSPQHQWSVLCDTNSGNYLMRINAKTRQIYAINHMEDTNFDSLGRGERSVDSGADSTADNGIESPRDVSGDAIDRPLSREEAKGQALHYLGLMGLPARTLVPIAAPWRQMPASRVKRPLVRTYNFAFADTRHPADPIVIAVNGANGGLQSLWSPVHPI